MFHPIPGTPGVVTGVGVFLAIGSIAYATRGPGPFNLDPLNVRRAFEPFLAKYLRVAEYVVGLATGSIVLLVGSSAFHNQSGGRLPWLYASPLIVLAFCVIYGVGFMAWLIFSYKEHHHGIPHTRIAYSLSLSLGSSALACFCIGYVWLIFRVTG